MPFRGPYKPWKSRRRPGALPPTPLGQRIRAARVNLKISQMDLATILKVPQQSISSWERGDTEPTKAGMESLVRFFGIQEDAFRTGIGFEIPKLPSAGFLGWMAGEDSLAVEEGSLRVLSLPSAGPGEAWEVDAATGRRNPLTKEQALELVGKAFDQKDVVWVVVKPHDENQPVLNTI